MELAPYKEAPESPFHYVKTQLEGAALNQEVSPDKKVITLTYSLILNF